MHWCEEEGCAGAAVTALVARKKRLCVQESEMERENVCVCVCVCARRVNGSVP